MSCCETCFYKETDGQAGKHTAGGGRMKVIVKTKEYGEVTHICFNCSHEVSK